MFSQTTEYALRAMSCLALYPNQLVSANTLAEQTKVPSNYLAKVLQQLAAANYIEGRRGVGGGYKLSRPAAQIQMIDVIRSVGRIGRIEACPLGLTNHGSNLCPLHRRLDAAAKAVIDVLDGVSLQDLISDPTNNNMPMCDAKLQAQVAAIGHLTIGGLRPKPVGAFAHAAMGESNGHSPNGHGSNGHSSNGHSSNGHGSNGHV
jgi:Rrf2 family protein